MIIFHAEYCSCLFLGQYHSIPILIKLAVLRDRRCLRHQKSVFYALILSSFLFIKQPKKGEKNHRAQIYPQGNSCVEMSTLQNQIPLQSQLWHSISANPNGQPFGAKQPTGPNMQDGRGDMIRLSTPHQTQHKYQQRTLWLLNSTRVIHDVP